MAKTKYSVSYNSDEESAISSTYSKGDFEEAYDGLIESVYASVADISSPVQNFKKVERKALKLDKLCYFEETNIDVSDISVDTTADDTVASAVGSTSMTSRGY